MTTRRGWAVATSVEQGECNQVLGFPEAEGHAVKDTQLGVRGLDECIRQVVEHGGFDARDVPLDLAAELDEDRDAASLHPDQPLVEHGEGQHPLGADSDPELLLHQVGPVELRVYLGHPGELVGLAGGQVLGVAPEGVAAAFEGVGVGGHAALPRLVPYLAADLVECLGAPRHSTRSAARYGTRRGRAACPPTPTPSKAAATPSGATPRT